jgi:hypothetical protein
MQYLRIDNEGFFQDVETLQENPNNPNYVNTPCTESFLRTRWIGDWDADTQQWKPDGKWVEGATDEEIRVFKAQFPTESQRDWKSLAIAFHTSSLYNVHLREATAAAEPEWSDKLWWLDKDITVVFTAWLGDELSRISRLEGVLINLFETLNNAKFLVSNDDKTEIINALKMYGFSDISETISKRK